MNVAVVYDFFPHYRRAVLQALEARGKHSYVFLGSTTSLRDGIEAVDSSAVRAFRHLPGSYIKGRFLLQWGLQRAALSKEYDAIVFLANPYFLTTWVAALLARLTGKRVLFWTHGWLKKESGIKRLLRNSFYRLSHALLLYGERAKEIGIAEGFQPSKLFVIYNSLDYESQIAIRGTVTESERQHVKTKFFTEPDLPMIVCCARLIPACRFDLLIDALVLLRGKGVRVNALLIGEGPERERLKMRALEGGVDVAFAGACYDETTLACWISAADCTVSPGKVGLTAMQSLAFGVPVITNDGLDEQMPEVEAITPGLNGELFRKGDVAALAASILNWTSRKKSRDSISDACIASLRPRYTPLGQVFEIERAIDGVAPLDDKTCLTI